LLHNLIFMTNVLRVLDEQRMTKQQLSELSGVSLSFISDITRGKGNPSVGIMEQIAAALRIPLAYLLECNDLPQEALPQLGAVVPFSSVAPGYSRVCVVLSDYRAFIVRGWSESDVKKAFR
jgi:transcriptional regulator with XRE-family HTH domain